MSRSSAARVVRVKSGRAAARAPVTARASGSRAHSRASSPAAAGSAATRSGPQPAGQHVVCFAAGQYVQDDGLGAVGGDQAGELVAAGDDDQAAWCAGQQRADLVGAAGVVEHDQGFGAGQAAAVYRLAAVEGGRDLGGGDGQGVEEDAQCLGGAQRVGRPEAAQVHIQLPAGEPPRVLVRPVHRQRGLTHPRRPADHRDRRRAIAVWRFWQQRRHRGKLRCPPGEPGNLGGQHPRARGTVRETSAPGAAAFPGPGKQQRGVGPLNAQVQLAQRGPWLDAELADQLAAGVPVGGQRRGLLSGPVQRQHQQLVHPFPQRLGSGQFLQLRDELAVQAQVQLGVDPGFQRAKAQLGQPLALGAGQGRRRHIRQRLPPPHLQRRRQPVSGVRPSPGARGRQAGGVQFGEPGYIQLSGPHLDQVPGRAGHDPVPAGRSRACRSRLT